MDFTQKGENPGKNITGISVVILLHVLIVYALFTGLARKVVEVIQKPVETRLIPELIIPDKPPPPPKKPKMETPAPKAKAPPPPFVPPPEVRVAAPAQQVIAAQSNVAPPTRDLPPPAPPVVAKGPAHTAPTAAMSSCSKPEYPRQSLQDEEEGTVTLEFTISPQGRVISSGVARSSGFKALDRAALAALSQCSFKPGTENGEAVEAKTKMQYVWKLE
ncbi:MAG: TonB family protein [Glaciimonas sp.]|nr:TonB family protein [Glaciimonas sp.]